MDEMPPDRLKRFLSEKHLLDLATVTPEGFPHVTPVWFEWNGKKFLISTTRERKKARNLMENNKAGFSIAPEELPYKAAVGYGTVEIEDDPEWKLIRKLCQKYLPPEKAGEYFERLKQMAGNRIILKLTPMWMTSWEG